MKAYLELLNIMPFTDDDPIPGTMINLDVNLFSDISISINQNSIKLNHPEPQTLEVTGKWTLPKITFEPRVPIDLVFVIEKSEKMGKLNFSKVREAVSVILEKLEDNDRVSIVVYDDFGYRATPLSKMTEDNQDIIRGTLYNLYLSGGRDLTDALGQAFEILRQRRFQNPMSSIFLISNSNEIKGASELEFLFRAYKMKYILHTFGYGKGHNEKLLEWIAHSSRGNYYNCAKEDNLAEKVKEAFEDLNKVIIYDSELYFAFNPLLHPIVGSTINGGANQTWVSNESIYKLEIPSIRADTTHEFGLEVTIPMDLTIQNPKENEEFLKIISKISTVSSDLSFQNHFFIQLESASGANEVLIEPPKKLQEMMEEARRLIMERKTEEAQLLMRKIQEELARSAQ